MATTEADQQLQESLAPPTELVERARHALRHIDLESRGDMEGTLATLIDDPVYELHPIGLKMTGKAMARRYYDYFFREARQHIVDYVVHGICYGETSLTIEVTVTCRNADGATRDLRNITVMPYAEGGITGERIYAEDAFFRLLFGPLLDELEPIGR